MFSDVSLMFTGRKENSSLLGKKKNVTARNHLKCIHASIQKSSLQLVKFTKNENSILREGSLQGCLAPLPHPTLHAQLCQKRLCSKCYACPTAAVPEARSPDLGSCNPVFSRWHKADSVPPLRTCFERAVLALSSWALP